MKWGIPVPDDPGHVFYVWMDALANYITALGFGEADPRSREPYRRYWEEAGERFHLVGKEIIRFHCLYWPAMLKAAGLPVPTRLFAHGHLTKNGKKLSKTTGNMIDPEALLAQWGPDAFRYFFLREGSFGQDWDFTDAAMVKRYNSDLANDLGNLVSRALTMATRYGEGKIPARPASLDRGDLGLEVRFQSEKMDYEDSGHALLDSVLDRYEALDYAGALALVWSWVGQLNQRIVAEAPWEMAKDPERRGELHAFLYRLLEAIRLLAVLCWPVMPRASRRVFVMLGLPDADPVPTDLELGPARPRARRWARSSPLFPRIETTPRGPRPLRAVPAAQGEAVVRTHASRRRTRPHVETTPGRSPRGRPIDISEFAKIELRAAKVLSAEKIAGSRKLLKLQVDLGDEKRQIVSGIADAYTPESLVGKTIVLVSNLKAAKLMGVESNGMVLAGSVDGKAVLCTFDADVPLGTKVR